MENNLLQLLDEVRKENMESSPPFGAKANGWENITIEKYLEAASAWALDSNFGRKNREGQFNENYWNQFATFLFAGKIYE
jgi:hypothetical protein